MKIGIISDTHDNISNIEKTLEYFNKNDIRILIHAGDLCAPSLLKNTFYPKFLGEMHFILGNVGDHQTLKKIVQDINNERVKYYGEEAELVINNKKIKVVHYPDIAKKYFNSDKFDLVIFGHNHESSIEEKNKFFFINPGTLGGLYQDPSFAVYDIEENKAEIFKLKSINI